ncbi:MAG TPA: polysaccharide biosynthesis/export family protein, partial [Chitinophagaceae bacterium]|nr:polysaccharide biosynthesis/export family protein [Chitinophagaceae bacterium]
MKKSMGLTALPGIFGILSLVLLCCSCGNPRELQYLQGQFDTVKLSKAVYPVPVIQKNDMLSISVYSDDPRASAYYNLPAQTVVTNTGSNTPPVDVSSTPTGSTYLVNEAGFIMMPGLGRLQVAGLTKTQLDSILVNQLKEKLQNPYVIIRMASYTITLIGEVTKPGQFTIPNERVSLLEAIALAGDLTPYGRRENILIIREINGERTYHRMNLKDPEILGSPYFYLQPNDVVIVDPNKTKASVNDQVIVRNIAVIVSIVSVLAVVV